MIIDAHQHFWDQSRFRYDWLQSPAVKAINRCYLPEDLKIHLDQCGIDKSVFVQVQQSLEENRWVLKLAEENAFMAGVVGWVDLQSPEVEDQILEFKSHPKFVGVRHVVQDEPNPDFIVQPSVLRGLKMLEKHQVPYDMLFYVKHLPHAVTVAKYAPQLPLVIDHLSKPKIKSGEIKDWASDLRAAAQCPNIYCKLSGMVTEADHAHWKSDDLKPYVDVALECFGPERLMYGSDWPVCELAASYEQVFEALKSLISKLSPTEQGQIWAGTANRFYKLGFTV
jgi:L-fuconolactonase